MTDASSDVVNGGNGILRRYGAPGLIGLLISGGGIGADQLWDRVQQRMTELEEQVRAMNTWAQVVDIYVEEAVVCQQALVLVHLEGPSPDDVQQGRMNQCLGNAEMIRERLERIRTGASSDGIP